MSVAPPFPAVRTTGKTGAADPFGQRRERL